MAHILSTQPHPTRVKRFFLPQMEGRIGFSFYIGKKEVFFGIAINDVIQEKIIRRSIIPLKKAQTRTYGFDPFSSQETNTED